ncbi:MAG: IgGFc-binding protein [Myxococcales bacterium]|nr:IgGFc-binding protein [Myxococcales bacterium]
MRSAGIIGCVGVLAFTLVASCGSDREGFSTSTNGTPPAFGSDAGPTGSLGEPGPGETRDPVNCDAAAESKSYVGCDYWPTVTPNPVWSIFDYTVVVANTGAADATITVTGPSDTHKQTVVPAGELRKIFLPWVKELKGIDSDACGASKSLDQSVVVSGGAYHLVSSSPVIVYQFNALQYKGKGGEGPDGPKDWSTCPGSTIKCGKRTIGCFSFSNDASLLLPSTAMTNTYRVMGFKGASAAPWPGAPGVSGTVLSITTTQPDTSVTVSLAPTAKVIASVNGQEIPATDGGGTITLKLPNAGDVAALVTDKGQEFDFSGSLVHATKPVQVITSVPCIDIPADKMACDHIEETVLPAETLGKRYVVTPPTGPKGNAVSHHVRLYGNKDGTTLSYSPSKPPNCPDTLEAGQVADCAIIGAEEPFEVTGTAEFGVATFLLGAMAYDWTMVDKRGDPSQSHYAAIEQWRTKYVFLAPNDYPVLYADITAPVDAAIQIDGAPIEAPWTQIGEGPYGVHRVDLTKSGGDGAHTLTAEKPVGVQVIGFGDNTSFQYPAGLDLKLISAAPVK